MRSKYSFCEEIILELRDQFVGRDMQVDPREILLKLDQLVNEYAKAGFLENWKLRLGDGVDDQFVTTFEWLTVTDPSNKMPSYVQLPAQYVNLPNNRGIDQIYFKNDFAVAKKKYFDPVIISSFKDVSSYRNTVGEYLEERIMCYPKDGYLVFDRGQINYRYGDIGIRLVVKDSSAIGDNDPYPIPADIEKRVINELVAFYRERMKQPQDPVKEGTAAEQLLPNSR